MMKTNPNLLTPVIFESVFNPDECKMLTDFISIKNLKPENYDDDYHKIKSYNLTDYSELDWFYKKSLLIIEKANQDYYNFEINNTLEEITFLEYHEGYFMNLHRDIGKKNKYTLGRKITFSLLLSWPDEFEGGELSFIPPFKSKNTINIGSVILYPAFVLHEVKPIIKGLRRSIIASVGGPSFR